MSNREINSMKVVDFIKQLQSRKIQCNEFVTGFEEDITQEEFDIWCSFEPELVAEGLDIEKHRWYHLETVVYKLGDNYLGVRGVGELQSDGDVSDCGVYYEFFEMEKIMIESFKKKGTA